MLIHNKDWKMKSRTLSRLTFYSILLLFGTLTGAVMQKYLGVGNLLRAVGIPYPTAGAPVPSNILPSVEIPQAHVGEMHLFILAGQSNMVGWAPIPEGEKTNSRIYVFGNDYRWRIASDPIEDAFNQVDKVSEDRIAGFGPSMPFALASLERHPDIVIGLIPCAKNSSVIGQWQRDLSDQSLYGSCLKRAYAASPMGKISGILFFQGETDAVDPVQYPQQKLHPVEWAQLFSAFITDFREDLHQPNLPVIYAQIGSNSSPEAFINWEIVQEQQSSVSLPMTAMISTNDLPLMDGLHFTAESYRVIGKRFSDAYWTLVDQEPVQ
jgi:hypothetical protein